MPNPKHPSFEYPSDTAKKVEAMDGGSSRSNSSNRKHPQGLSAADAGGQGKKLEPEGTSHFEAAAAAVVTAEEVTRTIPGLVDAAYASTSEDWRAENVRATEQRAAQAEAGRQAAIDRLAAENRPLGQRLRQRIVSMPQKQYFALLLLLVVLFAMAIAMIGVCESERSSVMCSRRPPPPPLPQQPAPTGSPTLAARARSILTYINSITLAGRTLLYPDDSTAEGRALMWLVDDDTGTEETDLVSLRQRYALATLLFQTSNSRRDDAPFNTTSNTASTNNTWGTALDVCEWRDVTCGCALSGAAMTCGDDDSDTKPDHVVSLQLEGMEGRIPADIGLLTTLRLLELTANRLKGTIPSSLGRLTYLTTLSLPSNDLTGTIPSSIGSLTSLGTLVLSDNALAGSIPSSLGSLTALNFLVLDRNRLTGTIPSALGTLTTLVLLFLSNNMLTGTIPSSLGRLKSLDVLDLHINQLIGAIPSSLGQLTSLGTLLLDSNRLTGTIPSSLASLTALNNDLTLGGNNLTGTIPSSFGALTKLVRLGLFDSSLTGTIPSSLGSLSSLQALVLNNNALTGTIPSALGALTALTALFLRNNTLTGSFPSSLISLMSLNELTLFDNQITGTIPFCGSADDDPKFVVLEADCKEVACPCCTQCW
jgi:Leucine-rich repeat (LRR) protein